MSTAGVSVSKIDLKIVTLFIKEAKYPKDKLLPTLNLLIEEECTIPFIARYRKEQTGNLDEVAIRDIKDRYEELVELENRRSFILETIEKMEKMTPELKKKILAADSGLILEDIYAPFKLKKKSKAQIAKDFGLEPLSFELLNNQLSLAEIEKKIEHTYVALSEGKIPDFKTAVVAAQDIIIEMIAHHVELKAELRNQFWSNGMIHSKKKKDADSVEEADKFKDFFEFTCPIKDLREKKAGHRFMAIRRGAALKILQVDCQIIQEDALNTIYKLTIPNVFNNGPQQELLKSNALSAWKSYLLPSVDLEIKTELKKISDDGAIEVFGTNLKNLLLQPYLGAKSVLAIDPGIRTGCKMVVIDSSGKFIVDHVIYLHSSDTQKDQAALVLNKMIEAFKIDYIAIGNGTAGLETLEFINEHVGKVKSEEVKAVLVSESGASVYSASDIAREEFPDKDVTVRGAISIARRFQDPLAELVKIDPKAIGVGQYQHDVNQSKLKLSLDGVVESCVNYVGVDLNTASAPLLSYISGIGPTLAKNVVQYREKNGVFKSRAELLKVPRFSDKVFEQAAGFLRIYLGKNPLDGTFIHPEKYATIEKWCHDKNMTILELVNEKENIEKFSSDSSLTKELGEHTFFDMVKSLKAPAQDPRKEFKNVEFTKGIKGIDDLVVNQWYQGVVTNITMFGAFVDIGIKQNGLLHVSEMSDHFTTNPLDIVQVGQEIRVKVVGLDADRKRIALSCKTGTKGEARSAPINATNVNSSGAGKKNFMPPNSGSARSTREEFKNNPFATLGNFKK